MLKRVKSNPAKDWSSLFVGQPPDWVWCWQCQRAYKLREARFVGGDGAQLDLLIPKNVDGVHIGRCLNQHHSSGAGVQPCEHIHGVRRAGHHHQVARLKREALYSIDSINEKIDKALRPLLLTVLEGRIGLRRAYDLLHGIAQFRWKESLRVWMAKQEGNGVL